MSFLFLLRVALLALSGLSFGLADSLLQLALGPFFSVRPSLLPESLSFPCPSSCSQGLHESWMSSQTPACCSDHLCFGSPLHKFPASMLIAVPCLHPKAAGYRHTPCSTVFFFTSSAPACFLVTHLFLSSGHGKSVGLLDSTNLSRSL